MQKAVFAIKIDEGVMMAFKTFCKNHGVKYSFFVEEAIKEKLEEGELKEDLLDFKTLRSEEQSAVRFEEYLRTRRA